MIRNIRLFPSEFGYMPFLWLCYMGFPIYALFGLSYTPAQRWSGLGLIAVFLVAYRRMFWVRATRQAVLPVAVQVLITAGMTAFLDPAFLGLTFFPLGMFGYLKSWRHTLAAIVGLGSFYWAVLALSHDLNTQMIQTNGLGLAAVGLKNAEIAQRLFLSEGTVRNYMSEILHKLGAKTRIEAINVSQEKGWL